MRRCRVFLNFNKTWSVPSTLYGFLCCSVTKRVGNQGGNLINIFLARFLVQELAPVLALSVMLKTSYQQTATVGSKYRLKISARELAPVLARDFELLVKEDLLCSWICYFFHWLLIGLKSFQAGCDDNRRRSHALHGLCSFSKPPNFTLAQSLPPLPPFLANQSQTGGGKVPDGQGLTWGTQKVVDN